MKANTGKSQERQKSTKDQGNYDADFDPQWNGKWEKSPNLATGNSAMWIVDWFLEQPETFFQKRKPNVANLPSSR